jgi:large subunit ribosomal protein L3
MAMLLGKKIGMTQIYDGEGNIVPVTVLQAGPCSVTQVKTVESDGYNSLQMGFDDKKKSRQKKPECGHFEKANCGVKRFLREWRLDEEPEQEAGQELTVEVFNDTSYVDVSGKSKGKGYTGVMKRHGFGGFPASHGTERKHRAPGSISSFASDAGCGGNLKKGKRMSGRSGGERVTTKNHKVISVDTENNVLVIKGAVPGANGGYVEIKTSKTNKR